MQNITNPLNNEFLLTKTAKSCSFLSFREAFVLKSVVSDSRHKTLKAKNVRMHSKILAFTSPEKVQRLCWNTI